MFTYTRFLIDVKIFKKKCIKHDTNLPILICCTYFTNIYIATTHYSSQWRYITRVKQFSIIDTRAVSFSHYLQYKITILVAIKIQDRLTVTSSNHKKTRRKDRITKEMSIRNVPKIIRRLQRSPAYNSVYCR